MNSKLVSLVKFNVEKNIRNTWFILLNVLILVVTIVALNFSTVSSILKQKDISFDKNIEIFLQDDENVMYDRLQAKIAQSEESNNITLEKSDNLASIDKDALTKEQILVLVYSENDLPKIRITSKEGISTKYISILEASIVEIRREYFARDNNISKEALDNIINQSAIDRVMLDVNDENSVEKFGIQTIFNYGIFFILILVLSKIANEVSQEKLSKSIEYVLTSINEKEYLLAKIITVNLTLIIQLIFSIIYFIIASGINSFIVMSFSDIVGNVQSTSMSLSSLSNLVSTNTLIYLIMIFIYVILTVLILSVIQAAFSSKTTNLTEASNSTFLLVMLNMIIYFVANFALTPLKEPSIIIQILACVPIFSMYFIPTMIILGQSSIIQIVIATILLIISVPFTFKICAKIFKNGVLDFTSKKNKKEKVELEKLEIQEQIIRKEKFKQFGFVIGFSVILFVLLQTISVYIFMPIIGVINSNIGNIISAKEVEQIATIIAFILSLYVPYRFVNMYAPKQKKHKVNKKQVLKYILISIPIIVILQIALTYLFQKLGLDYDITENLDIYNPDSILGKILLVVQLAILPAIFEELYIRKAVLNYSSEFGKYFAIIFSAILFSVVHLNISQMVFAFLIGIIFAIIAVKTKSIVPTMILHLLNNGYAALIMVFKDNTIIQLLILGVILILSIIGLVLIIVECIKLYKSKTITKESIIFKINKLKLQSSNSLYMFMDYTFIIASILCLVLLILTQNMLATM